MKVLVDNGHGENTPGKCSPDGRLKEWAYTREIADMVVSELQKLGIEAERIVREDIDVSLGERCKRVNSIYKGCGNKAILVSIHCNAAGNSNWMPARGWEAWTSVGQTKSDTLAECLYKAAEKTFTGMKIRKDTSDKDSDKESQFYILKNTNCPAVLTENFFQDNKEDVEYLLSSVGKQAVVQAHVNGIVEYMKGV